MDSDEVIRVLLVDDDATHPQHPHGRGTQLGNTVLDVAGVAEIAARELSNQDYDMVLVSPSLPNESTCDVLRQFRRAGSSTPIVMLPVAARSPPATQSDADQVLAALSGKIHLFARLHLILRQSRGLSRSVLHLGPLALDFDKREITVNGSHVRLSDSLYAVLELLVVHRGTLVTREMIAERLYGQTNGPSPKVIDIFIYRLRRQLAQLGADRFIHTVWGRGNTIRDQMARADKPIQEAERPASAGCTGIC